MYLNAMVLAFLLVELEDPVENIGAKYTGFPFCWWFGVSNWISCLRYFWLQTPFHFSYSIGLVEYIWLCGLVRSTTFVVV